MALDDIAAITFDVFGTVVDWRGSLIREGKTLGQRIGISADWDGLADAWRGQYQPSLAAVRGGKQPWTRLDDLHRAALDRLLPEFGLDVLGEADRAELNLAWHRLDPWPDVLPALTRMKQRFILVTLSNGNVRMMIDMAKRTGLPWDAILGAEMARTYKPLPAAYLVTADMLCLKPAQCLMVAAHYDDVIAAQRLGFQGCYVRRPREYGPREKPDLPVQHGVNLVVEDFGDLADRLGCG